MQYIVFIEENGQILHRVKEEKEEMPPSSAAGAWVKAIPTLPRDIRTPGDDRRENIFHSSVKKFETFLKCSHFSFKQCSCAYTNCLTLNSFIQQFRVN